MENIHAVVLAAGESSRMKSPKMVLPFDGKTVIEAVLDSLTGSAISGIVVVLGAWKNEILGVISGYNVTICENLIYKSGMLSSVQCGIRNTPENAEAILIFPGDHPAIRKEIINSIISAGRKSSKGIIVPVFSGKRGHPVLISNKYRDEILNLKAGDTLRRIMEDHPGDIVEVDVDSSSVTDDMDTPEDYSRINLKR